MSLEPTAIQVNNISLQLGLELGLVDAPIYGQIDAVPQCRTMSPGLADIQVVEVSRLGRRDKFPRPHDWENLLPLLQEGEELLWIVRKDRGAFRCYLGLKANVEVLPGADTVQEKRRDFRGVINHFCRRAFPESLVSELPAARVDELFSVIDQTAKNCVTVVSGVPSPKALEVDRLFAERDEERRAEASLNDVLEPYLLEEDYAVVFTLCRAGRADLARRLQLVTSVRSQIHPEIHRESGTSTSTQTTVSEDKSTGESESTGTQESHNALVKLVQFFGGSVTKQEDGWLRSGVNLQNGTNSSTSKGTSQSTQAGDSTTLHHLNAFLELVDSTLELATKHLTQTLGTGAYFGSIAVYAKNRAAGARIGQSLAGALSGSQSHAGPFQVVSYEGREANFMLRLNMAAKDVLPGLALLNTQQACQLLMLPDAELPGLKLKQNVFYGRSPSFEGLRDEGAAAVFLGNSAFLASPIAAAFGQGGSGGLTEAEREIAIPAEDLMSHMLITGTTGSGKTVRTIGVLNRLDRDRFRIIAIETAKKTFRDKLARPHQIYTLGSAGGTRFRLNPFYFDPETSLKRHISVLSDAMAELLPMEALIGPKLREAILACYADKGWDIETGAYVGAGAPTYPDVIDFNVQVAALCRALNYSAEINSNYRGALLGRSRLFIDDLYQDLFAGGGNMPFEAMFAQDTVLELDDLPPSEINMPAFVISIVLERLRAYRSLKKGQHPDFVVVLEEAHNVLHKRLEAAAGAREASGGKHLLEQVTRLLQEGRELGIGVIVVDQSPESLADAVVKNTNTKLIHRLVDGAEVKAIGTAIGLTEAEWGDLTQLEDGECVVQMKRAGKPVKLAPLDWPYAAKSTPVRPEADGVDACSTVVPAAAPRYADGQRLLAAVRREARTLEALAEAAAQLLAVAAGDVGLAGYMVGRYLVWHDLVERGTTWRTPTDQATLMAAIAAIANRKAFRPTHAIAMVALAALDGRTPSPEVWGAAPAVFEAHWQHKATAAFLATFEPAARLAGVNEDDLRGISAAISGLVETLSYGGSLATSSELLRIRVGTDDVRKLLLAVILEEHQATLPDGDGDYELRAALHRRDGPAIRAAISCRVPPSSHFGPWLEDLALRRFLKACGRSTPEASAYASL